MREKASEKDLPTSHPRKRSKAETVMDVGSASPLQNRVKGDACARLMDTLYNQVPAWLDDVSKEYTNRRLAAASQKKELSRYRIYIDTYFIPTSAKVADIFADVDSMTLESLKSHPKLKYDSVDENPFVVFGELIGQFEIDISSRIMVDLEDTFYMILHYMLGIPVKDLTTKPIKSKVCVLEKDEGSGTCSLQLGHLRPFHIPIFFYKGFKFYLQERLKDEKKNPNKNKNLFRHAVDPNHFIPESKSSLKPSSKHSDLIGKLRKISNITSKGPFKRLFESSAELSQLKLSDINDNNRLYFWWAKVAGKLLF